MGSDSLMPIDQALTIMGLSELPNSIAEFKKNRNQKLMAMNREMRGELMSATTLMVEINNASESIRYAINNHPSPQEQWFNPFDPRTWPDTQETREYITWKWVNGKKGHNVQLHQIGIAKASVLRWPNSTEKWPLRIKVLIDDDVMTIYAMAECNKRCAIYKRENRGKSDRSNKGPIHILNDAGPTLSRS
jgi:hypothetical protein